MPVFKQYIESSYKWGIWKTSESLEELLALLPHKEKYEEGIGKFTAISRKLEWLAVRVLLYTMLGEEKEIHYYSNGGPYLADGSFSISISHTKGYVAVLLGEPGKRVGIDIAGGQALPSRPDRPSGIPFRSRPAAAIRPQAERPSASRHGNRYSAEQNSSFAVHHRARCNSVPKCLCIAPAADTTRQGDTQPRPRGTPGAFWLHPI